MTRLEKNREFIEILDFVLNNCPNYDPSCEAKDCCECEDALDYAYFMYREKMADKEVEEYLVQLSKDASEHPEKYEDPPNDCVWGYTHCTLEDTDNCKKKKIIDEGKKNESNK